jgi:hypothetical protein
VLVAQTLVMLADTLVDDFDVVDLLSYLSERCVEVLDVTAAGLMLGKASGELRVMASSSEEMGLVELFEVQANEGPCVDCYRNGAPRRQCRRGNRQRAIAAVRASRRRRGVPVGGRLAHATARPDHRGIEPVPPKAPWTDDVAAAQAFADVATMATSSKIVRPAKPRRSTSNCPRR